MYSCVQCVDFINRIDFQRTIRAEKTIFTSQPENFVTSCFLSKPLKKVLYFFPKLKGKYSTTVLKFPPRAAGTKERQVQKFAYDHFIYVMAELIQKYAPEILK